jgi:2-dehydro-3-deoxyphosphogluconate aldolase / (4S)-4-hydroxy-2-oxoglutarate aldolase
VSFIETLELLTAGRLLPVVVLPDIECAVPLGRTLLDVGLPVIEITCRTPAALPAIRRLRDSCPELLVGAGTVLNPAIAQEAIAAGAQFLVSPGFNEDTARVANMERVPILPGVLTPTEIDQARYHGQHLLKLFPAHTLGGAPYIATLASVYPDVRFVPTGGISPENLSTYLALPSVAACGGSWLAPTQMLRERRFDEIWSRAAAAVAIVRAAGVVAA